MITWKVRGRSTSQTPAPPSTPMTSASTSFHQVAPAVSDASEIRCRLRCARMDWWASAVRMRSVAPTTTAEHAEIEEGRARQVHVTDQRQRDVRGVGREEGIAERDRAEPGARREQQAPKPIQRVGLSRVRASTHRVPATRYCMRNAIATTRPATKPPPGSLWPRSKKCADDDRATGRSRRAMTAGTIM